jgi:hypothetical protein
MGADAFVQCRVTAETKAALRAVAQRQHLSESMLLKQVIEMVLRTAGGDVQSGAREDSPPRISRLYVRLSPSDQLMLRHRAAARHMASATYAATLMHAHLHSRAPLPTEELAILRRMISELSAIGRNLNQIAHVANRDGGVEGFNRNLFQAFLKIGEALRDHVRQLIKTNARSWRSDNADRTT